MDKFKTIGSLLAACLLLWVLAGTGAGASDHSRPLAVKKSLPDSGIFSQKVKPALMQTCSPCHFPGGKMYASMPFDKVETILRHAPGILKRLGSKEEGNIVRQFLEN